MVMERTALAAEIKDLERKLSDPGFLSSAGEAKKAGKRHATLSRMQKIMERLERLAADEKEADALIQSSEVELSQMAREELSRINTEATALQKELNDLEHPPEELPDNVIMEIRAGTGGDEAALFARDLYEMYNRFATAKDWDVEVLSSSHSDLGGFKEVVFEINGSDVYRKLRYESGVHRIQRIPTTEKQGRIHTSTATVAVLPQVEDIDIEIRPQDLNVEFYRSSGAGGQNVNKVETAVRITHIPTGFVVASQEGRSQLKNRERAMSILRAKLYEAKKEAEEQKLAAERKSQIGTGDRSEKIRTYNIPQDRVTDHRINQSWHNIESIFEGKIEDIVEAMNSLQRGATTPRE